MWSKPHNIPGNDWAKLTKAWDDRKAEVYDRFARYSSSVPTNEVDGIMSRLLGIYYQVEQNAESGAGFEMQLRDEFNKGYWVEAQIIHLRAAYPELQEPEFFTLDNQQEQGTAGDKCMGGIIKAFLQITRAVCTERFGKPYGNKLKALRNGILERSAWEAVATEYDEARHHHRKNLEIDLDAPEPQIYRQ